MKNQRALFQLPKNKTFLNCAYLSPLPKPVEKAGLKGLLSKRNPFGVTPSDFFHQSTLLRKEFCKVINSNEPDRVAIIPAVSYGLANVAANIVLSAGQEILVVEGQFPSNIYPWQRLAARYGAKIITVAAPSGTQQRGKRWNEAILNAINPATRVVAMGNVHWADGTLFDLVAIRKHATAVGALLVIDGTQSVGAMPFDVKKVKPDALVCAGYKWLLGPYSIGMAWYGKAFDNGIPIEENWINRKNSEDFTGLVNYQDEYQPGALRYEVGEHSNFILLPMMLAALQLVNKWGPENIQAYCQKITSNSLESLRTCGWWVEDESWRAHHLFGIRPPAGFSMLTAKERITSAGIGVSFRGDAIRIAPHVYNTEKDLQKLVRVLTA